MPKQVIQLPRSGKKKGTAARASTDDRKVITKAVANLEGREGIAFTTWQTCGATREQSHVALTQQRWHWQAMTITAVLKIGIKVIGLESKLSLSERLVPKAKG